MILIESNLQLPEREIHSEGPDINGFVLHNCTITIKNFEVVDTPCGGNLCDRQDLDPSQRCACFQMPNRSGNIKVIIYVEVTLPDGSSFSTRFSSKWFLETYVLSGSFPSGVRAAQFEDYEIEDRFFLCLSQCIDFLTRNGGVRVIGWIKRGEVQDQGVDQPNNGLPYNAPRVMVQAGTLNHHITRIDPMVPENIDLDVLGHLKFDVNSIFAQN